MEPIIEGAGIVEYVTFQVSPNISDEQLKREVFATDCVLEEIPGYLHRFLAKQKGHAWVEVVFWSNINAAQAGFKKFTQDPRSQSLLKMIESDSVQIQYIAYADYLAVLKIVRLYPVPLPHDIQ